ncbi:hypothetical protein KCP76_08710 [Salmonella enterica subsp. enterica serovar Weltevreden]|nr:hypothetical protein KCP76_08710 [Salmonella enterica subsp. enterica serovar Weltevreden]
MRDVSGSSDAPGARGRVESRGSTIYAGCRRGRRRAEATGVSSTCGSSMRGAADVRQHLHPDVRWAGPPVCRASLGKHVHACG